MSMIWSSRERNKSCSPVPALLRSHLHPSARFSSSGENHSCRFVEITNRICKEPAPKTSKAGKIDYCKTPNNPHGSVVLRFFTDDSCLASKSRKAAGGPVLHRRTQLLVQDAETT